MNKLITLTLDLVPDDQSAFQKAFSRLQSRFGEQGVETRLYRDLSHPNRFMLAVYTDSEFEEITRWLHEDKDIQACFAQMREAESRVLISAMQQVA